MSTSAAVFELQDNGLSRAAAAIALSEATREAAYRRLRERRRQRARRE